MIEQNDVFLETDYLLKVYEALAKNTDFWFKHRCHPKTGLFYYSHGNDSGWDNASIFHEQMPVASPDLVAYLLKQCMLLEKWSSILAVDDVKKWQKRKKILTFQLKQLFYDHTKEQFVALNARTAQQINAYDSLILFLPLVAWEVFPEKLTKGLVAKLQEKFETPYGLATEALQSGAYQADGYWLGPIWAPVSYILIYHLRVAGYIETAERLRKKFIRTVSIGGMAENYNALTGKGNDDLGFTWSSAVYLLLAAHIY